MEIELTRRHAHPQACCISMQDTFTQEALSQGCSDNGATMLAPNSPEYACTT